MTLSGRKRTNRALKGTRRMKSWVFAAIAGSAIAAAAPASAATLIQTYTIGSTPPTIATITFNQFNPVLGRLNAIIFSIDSSYTVSGSVRNTGTRRAFSVRADAATTTAAPSFGAIILNLSNSNANLGQIGANRTASFGPLTGSASATRTITSGFAPYTGTGTINFAYGAIGGPVVTPLLNRVVTSSTQIASNFTLTYDYQAVPEPATWAMMIGGLGIVGGTLRRRGAKTVIA